MNLLKHVGIDPIASTTHVIRNMLVSPLKYVGLDPLAFNFFLIRNLLLKTVQMRWSSFFSFEEISDKEYGKNSIRNMLV